MKDSSQQLIQDRIRELRENTDFVDALFESLVGYAIIAADFNGNVITYNEGARQIYGYAPEEIIGKQNIEIFFPEEFIESGRLKQLIDDLIGKGRFSYEGEKVRKSGERFPAHISFTLTKDRTGKVVGFIEIVKDLTEQKQSEAALRESEKQFRHVIEKNIDGAIIVDKDGIVSFANPATEALFGRKTEELVGELFGFPTIVGETTELDIVHRGKKATVAEMRVVEIEWRGKQAYLASLRDITERKQAEAEKRILEQKAQLASRLASVGEMVAGITHEINNPLTSVIGFAQLLMQRDIPEDISEDVRIISDGAMRVADIVKRLLAFAREYKPERGYVDINQITKTTLALRAYGMKTNNIKVVTHLDPELPRTMADGGQIQEVFLNIIINAENEIKLAHGRGNLVIKTEAVDGTIRTSFEDDGPGIAKENMERIFNPFFTTREVGKGTGLGLSICHGIITEHGGRIYAESELGRGATFIVELPIVSEEKQLEPAGPAADEAGRVTGARILVVDDEPPIRRFLSQVLTDEGHKVETTDNADDALERLKQKRYNLILVDIKMPGMSGVELYQHIQRIAQSLARRVVFITGDVMGADTRGFLSKTKSPCIAKPFSVLQIKRDINRLLNRDTLGQMEK